MEQDSWGIKQNWHWREVASFRPKLLFAFCGGLEKGPETIALHPPSKWCLGEELLYDGGDDQATLLQPATDATLGCIHMSVGVWFPRDN